VGFYAEGENARVAANTANTVQRAKVYRLANGALDRLLGHLESELSSLSGSGQDVGVLSCTPLTRGSVERWEHSHTERIPTFRPAQPTRFARHQLLGMVTRPQATCYLIPPLPALGHAFKSPVTLLDGGISP
jgi:hypothetical protein